MEENKLKWKGYDASLSECIENYGIVYQYDGNEFNGWIADGFDENGIPSTFAPFSVDNDDIDDYFDKNGDNIAIWCGTTPEEMDYEWKMDLCHIMEVMSLKTVCIPHFPRMNLWS